MAGSLAKIERISDLRSVWPNEAKDFTPWLAQNIDELGEALGFDLELQETEAPVGGYSLDILATDINRNRPVIIENQLEETNHNHLGQLLVYAAGHNAGVVVWLTKDFREEHRLALDWLNQRTGKDTEFFGVVVELWKIDDSRLAPNFRLVATPNDWGKKNIGTDLVRPSPGSSERMDRYRSFFQSLIDTLREEHKFTGARKGQPQSWYSFAIGYGQRVTLGANFTRAKQARVEVYIGDSSGDWNLLLLDALQDRREEIESSLGEVLDWQPLHQARACRIALDRPGSIDEGDHTLAEIRGWMVNNLLKFKQVFGPHLSELVG